MTSNSLRGACACLLLLLPGKSSRATGLNRHKEIELQLGTGHAILYKPLKEWIEPVVEWANQS